MASSMDTPPSLTPASVAQLRSNPTPDARAKTAVGVAAVFARGDLTETERRYAIDIIDRLAGDVEEQVRAALSEHLKHCPFLPAGIAQSLARDVESVALPIIRYSDVLSDEDLLAIVRGGSTAKQVAVASRKVVTTVVSDALVDTRKSDVVGALLNNRGAAIGEAAYGKVVADFTDDTAMHESLIARPHLPASVTARLITCVSAALRERLVDRHGFPPVLADEIIMHGRDRAITESVAPNTPRDEVERLLASLRAAHGLSPTFLLRALSKGDLEFFESSLAAIARVPRSNVAELVRDRGVLGFQSLYARAGLPIQLLAAFRTALDVVLEVRATRPDGWTDDDTKRIIGGLVRVYDDVCPENMENVLGRLARRAVRPAPQSATVAYNRRATDRPVTSDVTSDVAPMLA